MLTPSASHNLSPGYVKRHKSRDQLIANHQVARGWEGFFTPRVCTHRELIPCPIVSSLLPSSQLGTPVGTMKLQHDVWYDGSMHQKIKNHANDQSWVTRVQLYTHLVHLIIIENCLYFKNLIMF